MPDLKKTMFREYDIRGREADDELNEDSMYFIGRGFGTYLKEHGVDKTTIGHDVRSSSEMFETQFIRGVTESGADVIHIGAVTTPMGYWSQHHLKIAGGAVVTSSHNPLGWNGAKLSGGPSKNLFGEEIQRIHQIILEERFTQGEGKVSHEDILEAYIRDLLGKVTVRKKFKVLVNTGNGTAAIVAPEILRRAGCKVVEHNTKIDPTYPHYVPNPEKPEMMEDTKDHVLKHGCDLGFAFDGDGDRLGLVDEKGNIILPDRFLIFLSRHLLSKLPGSKVIFEVKMSETVPEDIKAHGGEPIMFRTGHSHIKNKIAVEKAILAGEMSGHIFFSESAGYYGFDDAVFAALQLLEYLSRQNRPLSAINAEIPNYPSTPTISIQTTDEEKFKIVDQLTQEFKDDGYHVVDIDGARVYMEEGWGLVRASNTTPTLVVRFEAKTREQLEKIKKIFKEKLDKHPSISKEWGHT